MNVLKIFCWLVTALLLSKNKCNDNHASFFHTSITLVLFYLSNKIVILRFLFYPLWVIECLIEQTLT